MIDFTSMEGLLASALAGVTSFGAFLYTKVSRRVEKIDDKKLDKDTIQDKLSPINVSLEEIKNDIKEIKDELKEQRRGK